MEPSISSAIAKKVGEPMIRMDVVIVLMCTTILAVGGTLSYLTIVWRNTLHAISSDTVN